MSRHPDAAIAAWVSDMRERTEVENRWIIDLASVALIINEAAAIKGWPAWRSVGTEHGTDCTRAIRFLSTPYWDPSWSKALPDNASFLRFKGAYEEGKALLKRMGRGWRTWGPARQQQYQARVESTWAEGTDERTVFTAVITQT